MEDENSFSLLFNPLHSHVFPIQLRHMLWSIFVSNCHRWPTVGHFWMHDDFILGGGSVPLEWYSLWHFDISLDFLFLVFLAKSPPIWHTVCGTDFHVGWCSFALPWRSFCDLCSSPVLVLNLLSDPTLYSSLHPWVLETLPSQSSSSVLFLLTKLFMLVEYGFCPSPKTGIHAGKLLQSVSVWT